MLKNFFKEESSIIDEPIIRVLNAMNTEDLDSEEYSKLVDHLDRLNQIRNEDIKTRTRRKVSPDTMAIVAGNLLGILIIVAYEHNHVMASKATNFVLKTKAVNS